MDVPFISSGALSRAHYALVRKVEESTSEGAVNWILEAEVKSIRSQLAQSGPSLKRAKEALIILLYCSMTTTAPSTFPKGTFDFALPHALSLAEAGTRVEDKRIGYLFCAEMMWADHEMRLMLVNTLRKDLEDDGISRICLALDNMINSSSIDVIPAVQRRLYDLLSHNHSSVRRRALYAIRSLSQHDPELLNQTNLKVLKRLKDPDIGVTGAAMKVAEALSQNTGSTVAIQDAVNDAFESSIAAYAPTDRGLIITSLVTVHGVGLRALSLPSTFDLLKTCSTGRDMAVLLGLYRLFKQYDAAVLHAVEEQAQIWLVGPIRDYLTSTKPNEIYLFLSCLENLDPALWAGTSEAIPAVLEAWEVEQIMHLLDSSDSLIRKKTLQLLSEVDQNIVNTYYTQAITAITHIALPLTEINERTGRLLEVVEALSTTNGELYAIQVKDLLTQVEPQVAGNSILDSAVEGVLTYIRLKGEASFRVACAATMLTILCDTEEAYGPTMMVILAALATEYSRLVSLPPERLISGICHRLKGSLAAVQEPCLLAMLRISADCESIPEEVIGTVSEAGHSAGRHIRRRCDQFLSLIDRKEVLVEILNSSRSLSLPDFLEALQNHSGSVREGSSENVSRAKSSQTSSIPLRTATPSSSATSSKLRYEAYDVPQPIPSLRAHRTSSSQRSIIGSHSEAGSVGGRSPNLQATEPLSRTMTPGDLTLTATSGGLEAVAMGRPQITARTDIEELGARVDLIAFDSPSVVGLSGLEVEDAQREADFESMWNSMGDHQHRGWYDATTDSVIRQLQGIDRYRLQVLATDVPPFIGDLKITVAPEEAEGSESLAMLRLKESDDDGCLWRLRCNDERLRGQIKEILGTT